VKIVVPTSFKGEPVHEEETESHFVSGHAAMTLAGGVLSLTFIIQCTMYSPDAGKAWHFQYRGMYYAGGLCSQGPFSAITCAEESFLWFRQCGQNLQAQRSVKASLP
jgi:hypothetical protein